MDTIRVTDVRVADQTITCGVQVEGDLARAFRKKVFQFTYKSNLSLNGVPESIAVVPLLGTLLPLAWLFDACVEVDSCDADFYRSLPEIKQGYKNMYPALTFAGELKVGTICENVMQNPHGAMSFFSGGLDSHDTVLRHAAEKPALLILRGADISINAKDDAGWEEILAQVDAMAERLGSERISVETNFRDMVNYRFLNKWTTDVAQADGTYWFCFQHGLGLTTHAAPVAWIKGIPTIYIASTYTEADEGKTTCASDPTIDNHVHFCGAGITHDGYAYTRNDKLRNVAQWCRENDKQVYLRVCHSRPKGKSEKDGHNCCKCEKCYRTILGLYALREDPRRYGFMYDDFDALAEDMHEHAYRMVRMFNIRYLPIMQRMHENYRDEEIPESLKWFYDFKLSDDSEFFKWVDKRVVIEHENSMAHAIASKAKDRELQRLRKVMGPFEKLISRFIDKK